MLPSKYNEFPPAAQLIQEVTAAVVVDLELLVQRSNLYRHIGVRKRSCCRQITLAGTVKKKPCDLTTSVHTIITSVTHYYFSLSKHYSVFDSMLVVTQSILSNWSIIFDCSL